MWKGKKFCGCGLLIYSLYETLSADVDALSTGYSNVCRSFGWFEEELYGWRDQPHSLLGTGTVQASRPSDQLPKYVVPDVWTIGKVYARLIEDVSEQEDVVESMPQKSENARLSIASATVASSLKSYRFCSRYSRSMISSG